MTAKPIRLTPMLCRAARAFLGWRQADLSERSGVPHPTIEAFEAKPESGRMMAANARLLVEAFEAAGLQFIPENGGGKGIRFREPEPKIPYALPYRRPKPRFASKAEEQAAERAARKEAGTWTEADQEAEDAYQADLAHLRRLTGKEP